ncbi:MAG: hypothetical protein JOZ32_09850 [Bryobacterales bacterium]|nr:hypothetical protein [Bryobacterales bacterium]
MSKRLLIFFGVGLVAIVIAVVVILAANKGSHLQLDGKILKIRTGALGDGNSIAVLDFRVQNPSNVPFIVRNVEITLDKANGEMVDGVTASKSDLKQLFQYNRFLGDQYNDGLGMQDTIAPHSTVDRMVAAHFEVSDDDLEKAKAVHLSIQDVDGALWETSHSVQ